MRGIKDRPKADKTPPEEKTTLSKAAIEARREYQRNWKKKNPDKVKAAQARYWEKKAREAMPAEFVPLEEF